MHSIPGAALLRRLPLAIIFRAVGAELSDVTFASSSKTYRTFMKTNAVRLLDQLGIKYELRAYEVDPNDLTAESVAEKVGLPPEQVFKTLVARGDRNGICMAVIPGDAELDLKALANASGDRKIHLVQMKELLGLTGYIRGGVTAFAGRKDYPVFVDETLELFDVVSVSAGIRGLQVLLRPEDYLQVTKGTIAALASNF